MKAIFTTLCLFYKVITSQGQTTNVLSRLYPPSPAYCLPQDVLASIGPPPEIYTGLSATSTGTAPKCWSKIDTARDFEGILQCNNFACCLCKSIECGVNGHPCTTFKVSDKGAIGVQSIVIDGGGGMSTATQAILPGYIPPAGTIIECSGLESCKAVNMFTRMVQRVSCASTSSCQQANIILSDPPPNLSIHCNGQSSCYGATIIINIGEAPPAGYACNPNISPQEIIIGAIEFNGDKSAQAASITVNNNGCDKVIITSIRCTLSTSCPDTKFFFNGDVALEQCQNFNRLALLPQQLQSCYSGIPKLTCSYALECGNVVRTITNPGPGFVLECLVTDSCRGLTLTLDYRPSNIGYVSDISEFRFNSANAANGAIIKIENNQLIGSSVVYATRMPIKINSIKCITAYACNGLTIIAGVNVDILNTFIDCTIPGSCYGCVIKLESMNIEYPCDYKTQYQQSVTPGLPNVPPSYQQGGSNVPGSYQGQPIIPQQPIPQFIPSPPPQQI